MRQHNYLAEGDPPVVVADSDDEEQQEDDDQGGDQDPGSDPYTSQQLGQPTFAGGPGAPLQYMPDPSESEPPPVPPEAQLPPMAGGNPSLLPGATAPKLNGIQRIIQLATQHPGATPPVTSNGVQTYPDALKGLAKIYDQYPQRQAPNWIERVAAGVMGAAAGESNAARRAAPIDIQKTTEGILYPGYEGKLAAWQSRVVPAQQAVTLAGEQVSSQRAGELNAANIALKQAQTQMNLDRGGFYINSGARGMVQVTPAMEQATGGKIKAGTVVPSATVDTALNDAIKANPSTALSQKLTQLKQLFPNKTDDELWQAVVNPSGVGRAPTEAITKDNQIKADYASALGKDPAAVSDAEMNAARRMFGTGDALVTSGLRAFIAQNKRLPNPVEEHRIVTSAVETRANARTPASELPPKAAGPQVYQQIEKDKAAEMIKANQIHDAAVKAGLAGPGTDADKEWADATNFAQRTYLQRIQDANSYAPAPRPAAAPIAPRSVVTTAVPAEPPTVRPDAPVVPPVRPPAAPPAVAPTPIATTHPVAAPNPAVGQPPPAITPTPTGTPAPSANTYTDPVSKKTYTVGQTVEIGGTPVRITEIRNGVPHGLPIYKIGDVVTLPDGKHRVNAVDPNGNPLSVDRQPLK